MKNINFILVLIVLFFFGDFSLMQGHDFDEYPEIIIDEEIKLIALGDSVFVHVSLHEVEGYGTVSSNGMLVIADGKALLVDTPMNNDKTHRLCRYLIDSLGAAPELLIPGHFHDDNMGGIGCLHSRGARSLANEMTKEECKKRNLPVPDEGFRDSLRFDFHGREIFCFYPGPGHSQDNIVVMLPKEKILFGGCLIKALESTGTGNLGDASLEDWDRTVAKTARTFPDAQIIIPGHGRIGGRALLEHTEKLMRKFKQAKK